MNSPEHVHDDLYTPGENTLLRSRPLVLLFGALMLIMLSGDWFMRIHWFRWHETVYGRPVVTAYKPAASAAKQFSTIQLPIKRGGDLSSLIAIPDARARFEEERPAAVISIDPEGFRNLAYEPGTTFDYIVVGDSYMAEGLPQENQINSRISHLIGKPVLNRAILGRGPFQSLMLWIEQSLQDGHRPKCMIWGFIERDVSGEAFAGFVYLIDRYINSTKTEEVNAVPHGRIFYWSALRPSVLRKSLPNSSSLALISRKMWTYSSYYVLGQLPRDVFVIDDSKHSEFPMLGYRAALESMYWTPEMRNLDQAVWAIDYIRNFLKSYGIELLVVPIPDKEQVYRDVISPLHWHDGIPPRMSIIPDLIKKMDEKGIYSVSLFEAFYEARLAETPPYWRDDTHWNNQGIDIAARLIADKISVIMEP